MDVNSSLLLLLKATLLLAIGFAADLTQRLQNALSHSLNRVVECFNKCRDCPRICELAQYLHGALPHIPILEHCYARLHSSRVANFLQRV